MLKELLLNSFSVSKIKIAHNSLIGILLFSFLFLFLFFQKNDAQKRYLFRNYTINDGLINNTIFSINQDNKNYLWIATDGGISCFDGSHFDNTLIPQVNSIQAFCQYVDKSPSGKLAFATFMQGVIIRDNNGNLTQYLRRKKQLGKNVVRTLKWISDSKIITSESRNINMIDGDSIYQIYDCGINQNMFQTIESDVYGNIWFGGLNGLGIISPHKKNKSPYFLPEMKGIFIIKLIFIDKKTLLAGTYDGFYKIDISANQGKLRYSVSQPIAELKGIKINHLFKDKTNNIWISCVSNGVFEISRYKIVRHITMENGLPTNAVMCTFQDNENNYWFGTSSGLCRLYSLSDFSYTYINKQLSGISSFGIDKFNHLWLSDEKNIYLIDKESIKNIPIRTTALKEQTLKSMDFTKNDACFVTENGIYYAIQSDNGRLTNIKKDIDLKENGIEDLKCYFKDSNNTLWLGSVNGLFTWSDSKLQKVKIISNKEIKLRPNNILKDKSGYFWVADYTFGLYRFKYEGKDKENYAVLRNTLAYQSLKPDSAFATAWIQDMAFDHNQNLWISSLYTGVYKLELNNDGVKRATLFSTENGLSSNDVTQIIEGKDHSMWFATRNGADRLVTDKNGRVKIIHYNEKNGFGRYVYRILPLDSITYINYEEGFFAIDNHLEKYNAKTPLNVIISNVYVMGKLDTTALVSNKNKMHKIPYNHNFIAFEFGAVRLKNNEGIDYQYILDGIDNTWSEFSPRRYVSYNSLPPGKYTFKVRAKIVNNNNDEPITQYAFVIVPPFYKTIWFVLLIIILLASIGYFIYRSRIENLIKLEKIRTKIASDLHDDVGSTLSSISIMSDILHTQIDNAPKAEDMINKIGTNAHNMLDSMDDIIWTVNPTNDKFQNLDLRIREYAIPLFETKNITFSFNTPENLHMLALAMDIKRNIFLIAKEAVNNLVKYSQCSHADITFSINHSTLKMEIKDNGIGFDTEQYTDRNGLRNMKQRAEQIKGNLLITSEKGKGTSVILIVKII